MSAGNLTVVSLDVFIGDTTISVDLDEQPTVTEEVKESGEKEVVLTYGEVTVPETSAKVPRQPEKSKLPPETTEPKGKGYCFHITVSKLT